MNSAVSVEAPQVTDRQWTKGCCHLNVDRDLTRAEYGSLFDEVVALLFRHDPIGLNFGVNSDEYEPEAATLLPRLDEAETAEALRRIVHEEFVRWFGDSAGPASDYTEIARELWVLIGGAWPNHIN